MGAPRNISKGLVNGNSLDQRGEIIQHIDGSIAQPLVILEIRQRSVVDTAHGPAILTYRY